jgi:hypothetical protein
MHNSNNNSVFWLQYEDEDSFKGMFNDVLIFSLFFFFFVFLRASGQMILLLLGLLILCNLISRISVQIFFLKNGIISSSLSCLGS